MRPTLWPHAFLILMLFSCSTQDPKNNRIDPLSDSSVSLQQEETLAPTTKPELEKKKSQGIYGPVRGDQMKDFEYATKKNKLTPVTGLYLGPGLMRAGLHTNVLKALEYHGVQIHIISGMGLAAALATMYAFGLTPDLIEWRVFRFTNAVEGLRPLSEKWKNHLEEILLEDLTKKRIEQANIALTLPLYDQKRSKIVLLKRGKVEQLIRKQFEFSPGTTPGRYLSPMLGKDEMASLLRGQGADLTFAVEAMGEKLSFESGQNFLAGIYGRLIGRGQGVLLNFDKVMVLPTSNMSLDSAEDVDKEIEKSLKRVTEQVAQLHQFIKEWESNKRDSREGERGSRVFDQHFLIREND